MAETYITVLKKKADFSYGEVEICVKYVYERSQYNPVTLIAKHVRNTMKVNTKINRHVNRNSTTASFVTVLLYFSNDHS